MGKVNWSKNTAKPDFIAKNQNITVYEPDVLTSSCPIVAVHGMWTTNKRWENYGQFFSRLGFEFVAPTLRFHYPENNVPELGRTSVNDYVEDIKTLIEFYIKSGHPRPIVLAHSMGGLLGQKIAEAGLAGKLILLNSAPPAGISLRADLHYQLQTACYLPNLLFKTPLKMSFKVYCRYIINNMPKSQWPELYKDVVYESGLVAREIRFGKIKVDFSKITCPTLVIGSIKDKITPWQIAWDISQKINPKNCTFKCYTDFAHCAQIEAGWEKIAEDILNWLNEK